MPNKRSALEFSKAKQKSRKMPHELYSRRLAKSLGETPQIYVHEPFSETLVVQIRNLIASCYLFEINGQISEGNANSTKPIVRLIILLRHELGVLNLNNWQTASPLEEIYQYLKHTKTLESQIDVVELAFKLAEEWVAKNWSNKKQQISSAIEELNYRLKQHQQPYQYTNGQIIRIESEYLHIEATEPAIKLLHLNGYDGAQQEFMKAHEHFRNRRNKEAIAEALKAFESVMKTICDRRGWAYDQHWTAKKFIPFLLEQGLVDSFWQSHLLGLSSMLMGVATGRNKTSGHGQGSELQHVPDHLANYILNMTASGIVFLIDANQSLNAE